MSRAAVRAFVCCLAAVVAAPLAALERFDVGLSASGARIDGAFIAAGASSAPTVLVIGGLRGIGADAVERQLAAFDRLPPQQRAVNVLAIPAANPDASFLQFPATGAAYRDNPESHLIWRYVGAQAPDIVLIVGDDPAGLGEALAAEAVAGMGRVPSRAWPADGDLGALRAADVPASPARLERERRLARAPRQVAEELAQHYGHDFDEPRYIEALALVAQIDLGRVNAVRALAEPYLDGRRDSLARPSSLTMAGHVVFAALARATREARYVDMVRKVADLGFDESGAMRESLPYHNEFSDSIFMGTTMAAQAGALTGERKYFDLAARHLRFMQRLDLRSDGLYRHQPATDAAWGRGNGFAAIGLALTLSEFPPTHPDYAALLASYRAHVAALLPWQNRDGLWRNVIDHRGAYPELSATAMIGFAIERGLRRGWLAGDEYRDAVERAWRAVNARSGSDGSLIDVCESTARIESLDGYLKREALLGPDPRGGAMVLQFALELTR